MRVLEADYISVIYEAALFGKILFVGPFFKSNVIPLYDVVLHGAFLSCISFAFCLAALRFLQPSDCAFFFFLGTKGANLYVNICRSPL